MTTEQSAHIDSPHLLLPRPAEGEPVFRSMPGRGIGGAAVEWAMYIAEQWSEMSEDDYDYSRVEDEKLLGGKLKGGRDDIRVADEEEKNRLVAVLLSEESSPFIRTLIDDAMSEMATIREDMELLVADEPDLLADALTYQKSNRRYVLPNKSFLNVLQYYADRTRNIGYAETTVSAAYKELYKNNVIQRVQQGVLPPVVLERLPIVDRTPLVYDRSTSSHSMRYGHYRKDYGAAVTSLVLNGPEEADTVFHELTHALILDVEQSGGEHLYPGFEAYAIKYPELRRVMNEGMTEIITEAIRGEFYRGDPILPIYGSERNLIIALCDYSDGELSMGDFVDVAFSPMTELPTSSLTTVEDREQAPKDAHWLFATIAKIYGAQLLKDINISSKLNTKNTQGLAKIVLGLFDKHDLERTEFPQELSPQERLLAIIFKDEGYKRMQIASGKPTRRAILLPAEG